MRSHIYIVNRDRESLFKMDRFPDCKSPHVAIPHLRGFLTALDWPFKRDFF